MFVWGRVVRVVTESDARRTCFRLQWRVTDGSRAPVPSPPVSLCRGFYKQQQTLGFNIFVFVSAVNHEGTSQEALHSCILSTKLEVATFFMQFPASKELLFFWNSFSATVCTGESDRHNTGCINTPLVKAGEASVPSALDPNFFHENAVLLNLYETKYILCHFWGVASLQRLF